MADSLDTDRLWAEFQRPLDSVRTLAAWDEVRVAYMGKNGTLTHLLKNLKDLPSDQRTAQGQALNTLKERILQALEDKKRALEEEVLTVRLYNESLDMTLPPYVPHTGTIHPLSYVIQEVRDLCVHLGLQPSWGPDIEHEDLNFTQLNMPPLHPARSMHDTFYVAGQDQGYVLRTHTTPVQVRALKTQKPPVRIFSIGRTYRADLDATHTPMFHQVDGVWVDTSVHMGHMKGFLMTFLKTFFQSEDVPIRFRPSFFPFTEPSCEVDIGYHMHQGQRKPGPGSHWMEILGCGMIHPQVLLNAGLDPTVYQGFAFGLGIERLAMLKYGIPDLRRFYEGDVRWLQHFGFQPTAWKART